MKKLMVVLSLMVVGQWSYSRDSLVVVFWNVENFFDYVDGGTGESDREFSSMGTRHWTKRKFQSKCDAIAKSLLWIGDTCHRMPDVIGLAEVENRGVLWKLLNNTLLRKYDYKIVHFDSGDRRGIDVALLYRESVFRKVSHSVKVPEYNGIRMATRDMLQVCLEGVTGLKINTIVCHHPSKYGGAEESDARRYAAMKTLVELCDSLKVADPYVPVIAMGDFNDSPYGKQFGLLEDKMINKSIELAEKGLGTIRYQGVWELIDMFLVSDEIVDNSQMQIIQVPFLMIYEKKYPGFKPLRTYSGPRYVGGVSDHCPIVLCIFGCY